MRCFITLLICLTVARAGDRFLGWQSCASSGCHGGGKGDDQVLVWQKSDAHSRAYGTLISERSKRIAEALGVGEAAKSNQCTVCHSPMESAATAKIADALKNPNHGVSCEACHDPAENWIRFHTRKDITHTQRVAAGLRDLDTAYQQSNTCVGCHGNLPAGLAKAGHPTLRFELARQLVEMPAHWENFDAGQSAKAWLTSQAALLRELCWLSEKGNAQPERIAALQWVLRETASGAELLPADPAPAPLRAAADKLAKAASKTKWTAEKTRAQFDRTAALGGQVKDFAQAEALVPALRALVLGLDPKVMPKAKDSLVSLDLSIRSPALFDAKKFTETVAQLTAAVSAKP